MKRFYKVLSSTAAALFGIGVILAIAGWAMGGQTSMDVDVAGYKATIGWGIYSREGRENGLKMHKVQEENLAAFDKLDIDISLGDVDVVLSDHYGLDLSWRGRNYDLHYTNENGTLKVWSTSIPNIGIDFDMNYDAKVTVYLPEGVQLDDVFVKAAMGDVDISSFHAETLEVKAHMGSVSLNTVTMGDGTLKLDMGDLDVSAVTADTLELTLLMGKLEAYDLSTSKELTVENSMGDIDVSGSLSGKTKMNASMGDISISTDLPESDYGYDLKTSMGTVRVNGDKMDDEASRNGGTHYITADNSMGSIDLDFN